MISLQKKNYTIYKYHTFLGRQMELQEHKFGRFPL